MAAETEPAVSSSAVPTKNQSSRPIPLREHHLSDEHLESPWTKKTVLTFDGGGIRGYSSLLILKYLMIEIMRIESTAEDPYYSSRDYPWMNAESRKRELAAENDTSDFLPCHYFDYIAGTSTGGLSAIMLGRLRMTVDGAIDQYNYFGNGVFGQARWCNERSWPPFWLPRAKYPSKKTRTTFKQIIFKKMKKDNPNMQLYQIDNEPFRYRQDRTRTIAFSFYMNKKSGISNVVYLWRTYDHDEHDTVPESPHRPLNPSSAHNVPIWQVARATSAAPSYFESIKIGDENHLDGGMGANNPSVHTLREIVSKHGHPPAIFVSIGCGKKPDPAQTEQQANVQNEHPTDEIAVDTGRRKQFFRKWFEIGRGWKDFLTDTEGPLGVDGWQKECNYMRMRKEDRYRLNVEGQIAHIALDSWNPSSSDGTLEQIKRGTESYLGMESTKEKLREIATHLVDIRRRRAWTERWETFATDVTYRCPSEDCQEEHPRVYQTREQFRYHVTSSGKHVPTQGFDLESHLDSGRR